MSVEDLKYYHQEMRRKFPILALCENSWKADQIAIDNYSSWHTSYAPKHVGAKVKQESNVASVTFTDQIGESVPGACPEFDVEPPKAKPKPTFKVVRFIYKFIFLPPMLNDQQIVNTLNSPTLSMIPPSATQVIPALTVSQ